MALVCHCSISKMQHALVKTLKHTLNIWTSLCAISTFIITFHIQIQRKDYKIPLRLQNLALDTCNFDRVKLIKFLGILSSKNHIGQVVDKISEKFVGKVVYLLLRFVVCYHGTIIRTGITCKKILL